MDVVVGECQSFLELLLHKDETLCHVVGQGEYIHVVEDLSHTTPRP